LSLDLEKATQVVNAAFNGDATQLALATEPVVGQEPRRVLLWDGQKTARELTRVRTSVTALAWSPDSQWIAVGTQDGNVRLWSAGEGLPGHLFTVPSEGISRLQFDPEGRWLLAEGRSGGMWMWDLVTGELLLTGGYCPWGFSRDGRRYAGGGSNAAAFVELFYPDSVRPLPGHQAGIAKLAWSRDNRHIVSVDKSFQVCVWDTARATCVERIRVPAGLFFGGSTAAALSDDGRQVAFASGDRVLLREVGTGNSLGDWPLPRGDEQLAFADGRFLLVRKEKFEDGKGALGTAVYSVRPGRPPQRLRILLQAEPGEEGSFHHHLSADGRYYCWSGPSRPTQNRRIEVYELASGNRINVLHYPSQEPFPEVTGSFDADGSLWISVTANEHLQYDVTGVVPRLRLPRWPRISPRPRWAAFSVQPDELRPGSCLVLQPWPGDQGYLELTNRDASIPGNVSFSPNGRFLAWGSQSGTLTLVDLPALLQSVSEFERSIAGP
jgi:WD40 repeat protein